MKLGLIQSIHEALLALLHKERKGLVEFLRQLHVFDREMGYAAYGCPSTFEYLVRVLHLAEGTAYRRLAAMKLVHRYPQIVGAIEQGFVNATQLAILSKVITDANVDLLIRDATHLSKRKTEELVVSIRPREVPAPGLRKLPTPTVRPGAALKLAMPSSGMAPGTAPETSAHAPKVTPLVEGLADSGFTPPEDTCKPPILSPTTPLFRPAQRSRVEPVADGRWQWRIGLDRALKAELDTLKGYLAHKIPDGDLQKVFEQMLHDSVEKHGKRLGFIAPKHPRAIPEQVATPGFRQRVPLGVRRAVLARDGHRCTEICNGERCPETERLEMDHLDPANETGSSTVDDLVTKCRAHNQYRALLKYGRGCIERGKAGARREREARREAKAPKAQDKVEAIVVGDESNGTPSLPLPFLVHEPAALYSALHAVAHPPDVHAACAA